MRMQLIHDYLNAVCDMCAAEDPENGNIFANKADDIWRTMTAEEIAYAEAELQSNRWIKRVDEDGLA